MPEEEEEEPPPPPIASRPEKTKSIYTRPVEEESNANGAPLDTNRNPPATPSTPVASSVIPTNPVIPNTGYDCLMH